MPELFFKRLKAIGVGEDFFGTMFVEYDADNAAVALNADDFSDAELRMRHRHIHFEAGATIEIRILTDARGKGANFLRSSLFPPLRRCRTCKSRWRRLCPWDAASYPTASEFPGCWAEPQAYSSVIGEPGIKQMPRQIKEEFRWARNATAMQRYRARGGRRN